ncbi:unnamed protein product, partial [Adineta steineri]
YQCNHGHHWHSSWAMVTFRFRLDRSEGFGRVRMKRFGVRCGKCGDKDDSYHVGFCREIQAWFAVQRLLYHIVRTFDGKGFISDSEAQNIVIPDGDVSSGGNGGGPHPKNLCEACANNCCQEKYKRLTKKK